MLFAVEGGGFFSSSAKGYSKGLALLLLSQRNEEKPIKITALSQYKPVKQEGVEDFQLASRKSRVPYRCASFIRFGCASSESDNSSPLKVGPVRQPENSKSSLASDENVYSSSNENVSYNERKSCLKSSLKRPSDNDSVVGRIVKESTEGESRSGIMVGRKVQWTDASGRELFQIREFECSGDDASDCEYENRRHKKCFCVIQ
ncbi:uncharacterized protein LOC110026037 [Phalaenopsis equestris]|uniref:uncharacterized protein LOC110026037 n=1 Tax=Phalaenopsis equestris TaxID=78828 RepID=UPI0009E5920C|nr:uncharacterized protein LOC110026037 [Phalaenopsis equestris]